MSSARRNGDIDRSIDLAKEFATRFPRDPAGWITWAYALGRADRKSEARRVFAKGLSHNPKSPHLAWWLAETLLNLEEPNETAEAEAILRRARDDNPASALPVLGLARVSKYRGDWEESKRMINEALRMGGSDPELAVAAAILMISIPSERREARQILQKALRRLPNAYGPHLLLAVLLENEDPVRARKHIDIARSNWDPSFDPVEQDLAFLRRQLQRTSEST